MHITTAVVASTLLMLGVARAAEPFAVVELFTSQGCSSCPPADRVAFDLAERAETSGENILVLAFHVDYWDRLGWKDPFSLPEATARQRAYATQRGERSVYTPQMIVNGGAGFVGSDRGRASSAVDGALREDAAASLEFRAHAADDRAVVVTVRPPEAGAGARRTLVVALVQRSAATEVPRGENAGRTLRNAGIVRAFEQRPADAVATVELTRPEGVNAADLSIVAFVQDAGTLEIVAAGRVEVTEGED